MPGSALVGCLSFLYAVGSICVMGFEVVVSMIKGSVVVLVELETWSFPWSRISIDREFPKSLYPMVRLEAIKISFY